MTVKNRLKLVLTFTNFHLFALIAIIYGVFFGGLLNLSDALSGETSARAAMATSFTTGGFYFCFFSVAMIIIFVTMNTKLFKSFSVSEKIIQKMWHDLTIIVTLVNTIILMAVILLLKTTADYHVRILNMDIITGGISVYIILALLIALATLFTIQLMTLLSNIGNHHGLLYALGSSILVLSTALFLGVDFVKHVIFWGEHVLPITAGTLILTIILYLINKRMLRNIEVGR